MVTGASSGIGLELAKQFARHDFDLVLAAEDEELDRAAGEVEALGAQVEAVRVDLADYDGVETLVRRVEGTARPVTALAINAGVGVGGPFVGGAPLEDHLNVVRLNVASAVHLAHRLLPAMVGQGTGRVLITSSIAASAPGPFQSVYNGTKAFLSSFAEALREELKDSVVTVTSLEPGPTDTEFFERAGMQDTRIAQGPKDAPAEVARQGYEALVSGKDKVVAGSARNKVMEAAGHVTPDPLMAKGHRKMSEPGSGS